MQPHAEVEEGFLYEERDAYSDLATVESQRNDLAVEEFPEGPFGSSIISKTLGKSTPWRRGQRSTSAFTYENRELHEGLDRGGYPGEHDTHDDE
ncbi:hypothetical protein [Paenibacillus koleovorans]|uniref:hypothetical protein n=1 Tax=Paenibacillus koleovorans TaxID=121608 RepID=UPI000FD78B7D|nr:hypothetical protein [Paenibacillus koleovorans]